MMKKIIIPALVLVFSLCLALAGCDEPDSKTNPVTEPDSVTSIKLKYNQQEIPDDSLTVSLSAGPLAFTADVQVTGNTSTDFTLTSSLPRIATVSDKTVTLLSSGRTTITATAVGDSTKTHAIILVVGYSISVSGGTADVTAALVNQIVTLTPEIPAGKVFIDWSFDSYVQMPSANSFSMPSRNVTATANFGDNKPYYITNNYGEDSSTELLVQWHNYIDATQTLQIVAEPGSFESATAITVTGVPFEASSPVGAYTLRNIFRARITNLSPNTHYKYRVGNAGAWSEEFHHITSSGTNADFSFTVVSDPQSDAHTEMAKTLRAADAFDENHRFYIMGGDVVDEIGRQPREIVSYTNAANEFNIKRPIAATQGNHDTYYVSGAYRFGEAEVFNAFVTFPDNGGDTQAEKAKRSQCYYFYYNKVLIIMLNTMATSVNTASNPDYTRQANWLKEVLEKDRAGGLSRYTIVFTHIGPLGGRENHRWPAADSRKAFFKIYTDYGVDIVFSGHDHVYARSNPIKITVEMTGENDDNASKISDFTNLENAGNFNAVPGGTVFSVVSATGPKFYQISKSDPWIPKYFPVTADNPKDNDPGVFVNVKVTANKLTVTARRSDGKELDTYEVAKK
jgi:predicted phosphodiesterase